MSHAAKGKVDITGALLIAFTVVALLLALTLGGQTYAWRSVTVLGLFAGAAAGLLAYIIAERYASDPILPMDLFKNRVFATTNLAGFLVSMAFMSTAAFLPLFMQLGQGLKATASGLSMLPLMGGLMASAMLSGRLAARVGRYKIIIAASIAILFLGIFLLASMDIHTSRLDLALRILILGIGLGPSQSLFTLALQDAMPREQIGVVTSSSQFFRQIGSTMGVALFGTFLTNRLNMALGKIMPGANVGMLRGMGARGAGSALPSFAKQVIATAITDTFMLGLVVVGLAAIVVLFIPDRPLGDRNSPAQSDGNLEGEGAV
jgi:predicted MFS family arabinose efflux permease